MVAKNELPIGLADMIGQLRVELTTAQENAPKDSLRFEVGPIELELDVAIAREIGNDDKIDFKVVSFGGNETEQITHTHRMKIRLDPVGANGNPIDVNRRGKPRGW